MRFLLLFFLLSWTLPSLAQEKVVNVYAWTGEVPDFVVRQFEKETGIKVNISTYENNEVMYTKIRATEQSGYDIVMPSSYFVDRMRKQNLLEALDKNKIPNWKHLSPDFLNPTYDPHTTYSVPYLWGVTGLFVNKAMTLKHPIKKWADLWDKQFKDQLLLLDDVREVFAMALLSLGYSANDHDPEHIKAAFLKLKALMKNVKVFASETVIPILIDEDARLGMAWNGDVVKAAEENPTVIFVYPEEGFTIWVDNFSILKNAAHKETAYAFINFILRPDIAKAVALYTNFATTNLAAQRLLTPEVRHNIDIYPPKSILKRGQFQTDADEKTLALLEKYWGELKMGG